MKLTPTELLGAIEAGDVTWRRHGQHISYRFWLDEENACLVTQAMKKLPAAFYRREMAAGFRHVQRGPVELTTVGRSMLGELGPGARGAP
jgi:hypothetical protein